MNLAHPINCLTFNLQRGARTLARGFEAAAKSAGLTAPQFATLAFLSGMGEQSVGQLADHLGTDRTTLTRNIDLMVEKGWIEPVETEDRRQHVWRLTDAGSARLDAAMPAWSAWQARLVGLLGESASRDLLTAVRKL